MDSQPSFSRKAVATGQGRGGARGRELTTILQPKGGCDPSIGFGHVLAELTTILQPKGGCDAIPGGDDVVLVLTTILQPKGGCDATLARRNEPAVLTPILQPTGGCDPSPLSSWTSHASQPSFSRKAVATCEKCRQRCRALLTTILQPKGGCDILRLARFGMVMAHNHPSAERRLRRRALGEGGVRALSQPSFSRKAVATRARSSCGRRTCLTTILQPKGGCDWPSVPRGSW